ncbi:hypothetical protein M8J76_005217 [Diaphorina citri]|nr:hypothetical protein M8J76_005217 [Diaphorina citri]
MNPDVRKESSQGLSIDRAALILLRVKRVFRKKKQQRNKDKQSSSSYLSFFSVKTKKTPGLDDTPHPQSGNPS